MANSKTIHYMAPPLLWHVIMNPLSHLLLINETRALAVFWEDSIGGNIRHIPDNPSGCGFIIAICLTGILLNETGHNLVGCTKLHGDAGQCRPIFGTTCRHSLLENNESLVGRIRERITNGKVEISSSAYDTAWVAMVPSRDCSGDYKPLFRECLDWVVENQNPDGSWGLSPCRPDLIKDSLSCTLACVLALHKWGVHSRLIHSGLDFMAANASAAMDKHQISPIGFDVTFTNMVKYAKELDLTLPLSPVLVDSLLGIQESQMRSRNPEYVAEGFGISYNWEAIITSCQRSNGSLFNSPATTAAALVHHHNDKCLKYLISAVEACKGSVPTMYPVDVYSRLSVVDMFERLGIYGYFADELNAVLDQLYRQWQVKDEEMFSDITCLALAFRLLRTKGYDVSSEELAEYVEKENLFSKVGGVRHFRLDAVFELYRGSKIRIFEEEGYLERIDSWTGAFLEEQMHFTGNFDKHLEKQLEYDLKNFHGNLDAVRNRQSIEQLCARDFRVLKTAYRCPMIHNQDIISLSIQHFRTSQAQYQEELEDMQRWFSDCRLDQLQKGRKILHISYFSSAAAIVGLDLSTARIRYAQTVVLISCIDDFFDHYGSKEEALCIIDLVRNWDTLPTASPFFSREVEILFTALYSTVNDVAERAFQEQGWCIKQELVNMWFELLTSFGKEKNYLSCKDVESLEEYISFGLISVGCKLCISTCVSFLGMRLSEGMLKSTEWDALARHASVVCRLLNDLKTYQREDEEGALNMVSFQTRNGNASEEEALSKLNRIVEYNRRKVMQMVFCEGGIERECRELFWKTCKIAHFLYCHDGGDEFTSPEAIAQDINDVFWEPLI